MADNSEKIMFLDTGPVISLMMSGLREVLPELKQRYGGKFYITPSVQRELVERPLSVKRFEFEALQVQKFIEEGVLEVYSQVPKKLSSDLITLANKSFQLKGKSIDVIQSGEIESVACALETGAEAVAMDERTLRLFIENPLELKSLLQRRFRSEVNVNLPNLRNFSQQLKSVKIIRSVELVGVAYRLGLLDKYIPMQKMQKSDGLKMDGREILLDAVLWDTKYNGCAVTEEEIEELKKFLLK